MHARSALFDLFGDYLRPRGGRAPVAVLVRLLAPVGVTPAAVRTAISRMVKQGWLLPVRLDGSPGYQLSIKAVHRLDEAASRIYRTDRKTWNGQFDLLVLDPPESRATRARLTATLAYLGYGGVDGTTWVSPRGADEIDEVLREAGVSYERFIASHAAGESGAAALVRRAWDLAGLASAYERFVADQMPAMQGSPTPDMHSTQTSADESAYAARFRLVHAWRTFLFRDPELPAALLPSPWPGRTAADFFDRHEARLRPAADRFVDRCLTA
jgi:phenylacetic acid degradation operon negative regulatory protein